MGVPAGTLLGGEHGVGGSQMSQLRAGLQGVLKPSRGLTHDLSWPLGPLGGHRKDCSEPPRTCPPFSSSYHHRVAQATVTNQTMGSRKHWVSHSSHSGLSDIGFCALCCPALGVCRHTVSFLTQHLAVRRLVIC